jgi:hypothetical protein
MTEDEAKQKWCPMARGLENGGNYGASCIASACMMWQWIPRFSADKEVEMTKRGYCGLAG